MAAGRGEPAPDWPLVEPSPRELELWEAWWAEPVARIWEETSSAIYVAFAVRMFAEAEQPKARTEDRKSLNQMMANLYLTPDSQLRARILIVSPSLLLLSIQVIQAVLKDQRMREQAHLIQGEVIRLMEDVSRLDDRVRKLQTHFGQASKDIDDILVSSSKVTKRGQKIEALEFGPGHGDGEEVETARISAGDEGAVKSRSGQLRLRVVDESV